MISVNSPSPAHAKYPVGMPVVRTGIPGLLVVGARLYTNDGYGDLVEVSPQQVCYGVLGAFDPT